MPMRFLTGLGLLAVSAFVAPIAKAETPARSEPRCAADRLAFGALTDQERRRFQSRYRTRVRVDGEDTAERFLYEQVCLTVEERRALRPRSKNQGTNCRAVATPVTSMDGSMTVGTRQVCD